MVMEQGACHKAVDQSKNNKQCNSTEIFPPKELQKILKDSKTHR